MAEVYDVGGLDVNVQIFGDGLGTRGIIVRSSMMDRDSFGLGSSPWVLVPSRNSGIASGTPE